GDLGKTQELSRITADRVDRDGRPEAAAVLAYPPAFGFVAALARRELEGARRDAGRPFLLGIEPAEMVPDDFVGGVALYGLPARVPVGHHAARVEHVDRVIDDALDQQAEQALALEQCPLRFLSFGHVAGDFGEADKPARRGADGLRDGHCPELRAVLADPPA